MIKEILKFFLLLACLLLLSCKESNQSYLSLDHLIDKSKPVKIEYAKGFTLQKFDEGYILEIKDPQDSISFNYKYVLIKSNYSRYQELKSDEFTVIELPITRAICMTSLQLSAFIKLEKLENICGITSTRHLFNGEVKDRIENGDIRRIGIEGNFDNEIVMEINPQIIFISPFKRGGYETLAETGIPLMPHLGYKEKSPLGQAEWIRLIGVLTDSSPKADSLFSIMSAQYNALKNRVDKIEKRPKILSGEMRGGNWYVVGGDSFLANLFKDAGADYFLKEDSNSGGLEMDFESVYNLAHDADFWRLLVSHPGEYNYQTLSKIDSRYTDFKAYQNRSIIFCNLRDKPFYENSPMEPQIVLADIIKAIHPDILPEHTPVYYSILNK